MPGKSYKSNGNAAFLTQPMYTYREVARLSGVSVGTVRNWVLGFPTGKPPLFDRHADDEARCSFISLVEIMMAARFRKAEHVSFPRVCQAYQNARRLFKLEYPFANSQLQLRGIGGHIVHIIRVPGIALQAVDQPEQCTIPDLVQRMIEDELDYENQLASRWYPAGKAGAIVVDPQVSAGVPVIKGRGVSVDTIYRRWKADQKINFIARDFQLPRDTVEDVIRWQSKRESVLA